MLRSRRGVQRERDDASDGSQSDASTADRFVDAPIPEGAEAATTQLAAALAVRKDHTRDQPQSGGFFERNGLLYLPKGKVARLTAGLTKAGPLLGSLSADPSLRGALDVHFFAGAGIGACGIERGLFGPNGALVKRWPIWLAIALGSFMVWLALTALVVRARGTAPIGVQALDDLSYVLACFGSCFCVLALALRFAAKQGAWLGSLSGSAYGMYLVHYLFVVWLQYAFLPVDLPAVVKAAAVFACTVLLSWTTTAALRRLPAGALIVGGGRRITARSLSG